MEGPKRNLKAWQSLIATLDGMKNLGDLESVVIKPIQPPLVIGPKKFDMRAYVIGKAEGSKGDFFAIICHQDDCNWGPCPPEPKNIK
jgi:hypothetical protein